MDVYYLFMVFFNGSKMVICWNIIFYCNIDVIYLFKININELGIICNLFLDRYFLDVIVFLCSDFFFKKFMF